MNKIKFSHEYYKMPSAYKVSKLAEVVIVEESELSDVFREYDTSIKVPFGGHNPQKFYDLPHGKLILLLLIANEGQGWLWCTLRRWTPEKEHYYRSRKGERFEIEIHEAH